MGSQEMREDSCVPCRWGEGTERDSEAMLCLAVKAWGISWGAYTHSHREAQGVCVWVCMCVVGISGHAHFKACGTLQKTDGKPEGIVREDLAL